MSAVSLEIHYANEWAALYVDGLLVEVGDSYLAEQKAFSILGVKTVQDDAFMRGQDQRNGVAKNLAEIASYREEREKRMTEAGRLRAEAERMLAEAAALEATP